MCGELRQVGYLGRREIEAIVRTLILEDDVAGKVVSR